jgi:hypothetical protein
MGSVYLTYTFAREHLHLKQIGLGFGLIALGFQFGNLKAVSLLSEINLVNQSVGDYATHLQAAVATWQHDLSLPLIALSLCVLLIAALPKAKILFVPNQKTTTLLNHYKLAWKGQYPLLPCLGFVYGLGIFVVGLGVFIGLSAMSADYTMQIHADQFAFSTEVNTLFKLALLPYFLFATICAWRCAVSEERTLRYATRTCLVLLTIAYLINLS